MAKRKLQADFEINASKKMLYPYIYTASGLAQWCADDVTVNEDKVFNFIWDNDDHPARMIAHRVNTSAKFEYLPESDEDEDDPASFELRLEVNELTQTTFLHVTEYTDFDDEEEWYDLWNSMVHSLKEIVGG